VAGTSFQGGSCAVNGSVEGSYCQRMHVYVRREGIKRNPLNPYPG